MKYEINISFDAPSVVEALEHARRLQRSLVNRKRYSRGGFPSFRIELRELKEGGRIKDWDTILDIDERAPYAGGEA